MATTAISLQGGGDIRMHVLHMDGLRTVVIALDDTRISILLPCHDSESMDYARTLAAAITDAVDWCEAQPQAQAEATN